jgi:hypothetical protein
MARRTLLGKIASLSRRQRVYRTDEALEIDDCEDYTIRRSRLFYDEIVLVTYHRRIGWLYVLVFLVVAAVAAFVAFFVGLGGNWAAAAVTFALLGFPPLAAAALRLALRLEVVTVYGKRTAAQMEFFFRKQRARDVYELVCRLAREHQDRVSVEAADAPPLAT